MYRLDSRYGKLLGYLLVQNKLVSLEDIAKEIGVSKSTVWRDLTFLESILPDEWKIEKDQVSGVSLQKSQEGTLEKLWSELRRHCAYFQILKFILFHNGTTLQEIMEYFHMSRSTVYRYLKEVDQAAERAGVKLTASPYKITGDEKKVRNFYMQFWGLMDDDTRTTLCSHGAIDESRLQEILLEYEMILESGAPQRLMVALNISNLRISHGNYVSFPIKEREILKKSEYFQVAHKLLQQMKKYIDKNNQFHEILYVTLHLMAEEKTLRHSKELYHFRNNMEKYEANLMPTLLKRLSEQVGFDLGDDDIFLTNMLQINKKISILEQFGIDTEMSGIIQYLYYVENHPLFHCIEESLSDISEREVKREHLINIFFLLQAAILRKKNKCSIHIALIAHTSVERDYIYEVLKESLGNRANISSLDDVSFELVNHRQFDLFIATHLVDIKKVKYVPTMKISSIPTFIELSEVENFIENYFSYVPGLDKKMIYSFPVSEGVGS